MSDTVQYALDRLRRELHDTVEPYFWADDELMDYIDEGQVQFCTKGIAIRDSRTPKVCHLEYKAGQYEIPLHESIMKIRSIMRMDSNNNLYNVDMAMQETALEMFPIRPSDYGINTVTTASQFNSPSDRFAVLVDYDEGYLRLSSPALTDGTLLLQVERLPLDRITDCEQELEVRREHVVGVLEYAKHRAWSKEDAETFDERAANRAFEMFIFHADGARIEQKRRTSQPGTVKYGGL